MKLLTLWQHISSKKEKLSREEYFAFDSSITVRRRRRVLTTIVMVMMMMMVMMMIMMMMMMMILILILITITLKSAIRDLLQSPHCAETLASPSAVTVKKNN